MPLVVFWIAIVSLSKKSTTLPLLSLSLSLPLRVSLSCAVDSPQRAGSEPVTAPKSKATARGSGELGVWRMRFGSCQELLRSRGLGESNSCCRQRGEERGCSFALRSHRGAFKSTHRALKYARTCTHYTQYNENMIVESCLHEYNTIPLLTEARQQNSCA